MKGTPYGGIGEKRESAVVQGGRVEVGVLRIAGERVCAVVSDGRGEEGSLRGFAG